MRRVALPIPEDRRSVLAAILCVLSLAFCFQQGWMRSGAGIDLAQYVIPARLWLEGINPYDVAHYREHYARYWPNPTYWYYAYPGPPHAILMMLPLALLPWGAALKVWWVVNFCCLLVSFACLLRLFGKDWSPTEKWLFVALLAQSRLIQSVAYRGQLSLFELALVLVALVWVERGWRIAAGILLGLACMKYTLALPLVLYFVWKREWVPLAWGAALAFGGGLIAALPLGLETVARTMPESLAYFGRHTALEVEGNYHLTQWQSLYASAFGRTSPIALLLNLLTLAVTGSLLILLAQRFQGKAGDRWGFAVLVMFSLTVVYHRVYDGVFAFVVAAALWNLLREPAQRRRPEALTFATVLFLFLFIFAHQNFAAQISASLAAYPALMPINAWACLILLVLVFRFAWESVMTQGAGVSAPTMTRRTAHDVSGPVPV